MIQVYTSFGYDGVGAPRRIKDELVDELKKEGKTWDQVVKESVAKLSLKGSPPTAEVKKGEAAVSQLIAEAEHLIGLLDKLGEKMEKEAVDASVTLGEVQASALS